MAQPYCVLHEKVFSRQKKHIPVDHNNYDWLDVPFEKIGSVVCIKCYKEKSDASRTTPKKVSIMSANGCEQKLTTDPFSSH